MDTLYLIPGSLGERSAVTEELDRRKAFLDAHAPNGCRIDLALTGGGPATVESEADEQAAERAVLAELPEVEKVGWDAVIVGCFGDPGVAEAQRRVDLTVVGPAEASFRTAGRAGAAFGVLTVVDDVVPLIGRRLEAYGFAARVPSVRAIGVGVAELRENREQVAEKLVDAGRLAVGEGADALVLGCMTMGFLGLDRDVAHELDVPVVNPVLSALDAAADPTAFARSHM